jgi:hypothetical protein
MEPLDDYTPLPTDHEIVKAIHTGTQNRIMKLEVLQNCEEVIIMGTCTSYYTKQMAQESIKSKIPVGCRLKNVIIVKPE